MPLRRAIPILLSVLAALAATSPLAAVPSASIFRAPGLRLPEAFFARNASESLPEDTPYIRYVQVRSERLTRFHRRPVYLRAGVLVPRGFEEELGQRYPLWIRIGGFGSRYTFVKKLGKPNKPPGPGMPQFVTLFLDGDGPYGDPSQVNSANNGPYGDAVTQELIPHVERQFRCIGKPYARFLSGSSTGGWASLALQTFYPDTFNGAYAFWPDPVDFRAFETINIYADDNAYRDPFGEKRPSKRARNGHVLATVEKDCQTENARGGGSYTLSGRQWGAWNAIFSPRGRDGHPAPLWDPDTGKIDRAVAEQWRDYDLRYRLQRDWRTLGPKLRNRLHVWVGEEDQYFLNEAVSLLRNFLLRANPPFTGVIVSEPEGGHGGFSIPRTPELLEHMVKAMERARNEASSSAPR